MPPIVNHASASSALSPGLADACHRAAVWSRVELIALAVSRGCRHYAGFSPAAATARPPELPHEVLGCALLRGPADADTFRAIRVGAMVLSDPDNQPEAMAEAAHYFGVESRLVHLARVGLKSDSQPDFWAEILERVPATESRDDIAFLPGASRFSIENPKPGAGGAGSRVWLRTNHRR